MTTNEDMRVAGRLAGLLRKLSPNTAIPDIDIDGDEHALRQAERLREWVATADRVLALNSVDTYLLALRMAIVGLTLLSGINLITNSMTLELALAVGFSAVVCVMLYISVRRSNQLSHWERWVPNIFLLLPHSYGLYVNGNYASSVTLAVIMGAYMTLPRASARILTAWYLTAFLALWAWGASDPDLLMRQSLTVIVSVLFLDALTGRIAAIVSFMRALLRSLETLRQNVDNEYLMHRNDYARLRRFRRQVDLARDMLMICRLSDGRIVDCNPATADITGHSRETLLEMHLWELSGGTETEDAFFSLCQRLDDSSEHRDQSAVRHVSGRQVPVERAISIERASDLMLVLARDISERLEHQQAEQALSRQSQVARLGEEAARAQAELAQAARMHFLNSIGHEVRTPLQGISGSLQLLRSHNADPQNHRYIDGALEGCERLMDTLSDILDFSAAQSGQLGLNSEPFDARQLWWPLFKQCEQTAADKGLSLQLSGLEQLPTTLVGDRDRLRRISQHLLANAIRHTNEGSVKLMFGVTPGPSPETRQSIHLTMTVSDTGKGIHGDLQRQVFEPFTQLQRVGQSSAGGTGIGLAFCRAVAEAMGGTLLLQSTPGRGSTLTLRLELEYKPTARA